MLNEKLKLNPELFKNSVGLKATRDGFGAGLVGAAQKNEKIVVLTADLEESTRVADFAKEFPERFWQVGVAEQALVTIASGMAIYGKTPFVTSFAVFSPGRNWEQIRTTIALNNAPVKLVGGHTGLDVGEDGATHQMLEDIALMRVLPNMDILLPCDFEEAKKAVLVAAESPRPSYIRLTRSKTPVITTPKTPFTLGKVNVLWQDKDPKASLIAVGPLVYEALVAADKLKKAGIALRVVSCHSLAPLDEQAIIHEAKISGAVVSVEDHQIKAGLGGAIAEILAQNYPVPMEFVGVANRFGQSGEVGELKAEYGLGSDAIIKSVKRVLARVQHV